MEKGPFRLYYWECKDNSKILEQLPKQIGSLQNDLVSNSVRLEVYVNSKELDPEYEKELLSKLTIYAKLVLKDWLFRFVRPHEDYMLYVHFYDFDVDPIPPRNRFVWICFPATEDPGDLDSDGADYNAFPFKRFGRSCLTSQISWNPANRKLVKIEITCFRLAGFQRRWFKKFPKLILIRIVKIAQILNSPDR